MSSAFTSLITKIENYYADRDYTTQDAEYLSRLAIIEYASEKNALVASARQVPTRSVEKIIDIAIAQNLKAEPSEWMVFAANAVDNVLGYSHEGIIASGIGLYTDLLPEGHPSRTNRPAMTASAAARATALWVAGDPRIASDQARLDVYNAYATKPGSVEAEYAGAKLSALVSSGYVPEDVTLPITAAFKMNFAMRSAIAKALAAVRRRHGDGRFAEEFGRLRGFFGRKDGSIFSSNGRIVGAVPNTNNFEVAFPGDADIPKGVYTIDAARTASVKAVLSKRAMDKVKGLLGRNKSINMPTESQKRMAVPLDDFLATRKDAPSGWTKNDDGSFTSKSGHTSRVVDTAPKGDYMTEGTGESGKIDPTQPIFELTDKDGKTLGVAQDWAGLNKISMSYDALEGKGPVTEDEPGFDQSAGKGYQEGENIDDIADDISTRGNGIVDQIEELGAVDGESPEEFQERIADLRSKVDGFASTVRVANQDIVERSGIDPDRSISGDDFDPLYDELQDLASEGIKRRADAAYFPGQPSRYYKSSGSDRASLIKELDDAAGEWSMNQGFGPEEADEAADRIPDPEVTADYILEAEKSGDTSQLRELLDPENYYNKEDGAHNAVIEKAIERIEGGQGFDQKAGDTNRPELARAEEYVQEFKDAVGDQPRAWRSKDGRVRISRSRQDLDIQDDVIKNMDEWVVRVDDKEVGSLAAGSYSDKSIDELNNPTSGSFLGLKNIIEGGLTGDPEKARQDALDDWRAAQEAKRNTPEAIAARENNARVTAAREQIRKDAADARKAADVDNLLENADSIAEAVADRDRIENVTEVDLGNGFMADFGSWDGYDDGDGRYGTTREVSVYSADENSNGPTITFSEYLDENGEWMTDGSEVKDAIFEALDRAAGNVGTGYDPKNRTYTKVAGKDVDPGKYEMAGFDQATNPNSNPSSNAIDFDHLTEPQNWSQFKEGEATYTSPDGKLKLTFSPSGDPDGEGGVTDGSSISVTYDGMSIGSFRATQRDLEEGDIESGLTDLLKKSPMFNPDESGLDQKAGSTGKGGDFPGTSKKNVRVLKPGDKVLFNGKVLELSAQEGDPERLKLYDDDGDGVVFAKDGDGKTYIFSAGDNWLDDLNVLEDQNTDLHKRPEIPADLPTKRAGDVKVGDTVISPITGKPTKVAQVFNYNQPSYKGEGYDSPMTRIIYEDGTSSNHEEFRGALAYPKGEGFDQSVDPEEQFARDQEAIAQKFARDSVDTDNLLGNIDDIAEEIFYNDEGKTGKDLGGIFFTVSDIDSDGQVRFRLFDADSEEIGSGYFRPDNDDSGIVADQLLPEINAYLDKKLDELEPPEGLDQKAGDAPAFLEEDPKAIKLEDKGSGGLALVYTDPEDKSSGDIQRTIVKDSKGNDAKASVVNFTKGQGEGLTRKVFTAENTRGGDFDAAAQKYLRKLIADDNKARNREKSGGFSPKQMEPATDKQYALLEELNSERDDIDPVTQEAINDALDKRNMSKAQISSLFGELQKKPFKPGIDPTKPTDRQIDSLQGYLTSKDLSPEEMTDALDQLEAGLDRAGMESLIAKLRRRPDRTSGGFDQSAGEGFRTPDAEIEKARAVAGKFADEGLQEKTLNFMAGKPDVSFSIPVDPDDPYANINVAWSPSQGKWYASASMLKSRSTTDSSENGDLGSFDTPEEAMAAAVAFKNDPDRMEAYNQEREEVRAEIDEEIRIEAENAIAAGDKDTLEDYLADSDFTEYHDRISDALDELEGSEDDDGFDQSAGDSEWTKELTLTGRNGRPFNASPDSADSDIRDRIDAAIEKGVTDGKARLAELEANGEGDSDEAEELKRGIRQFGWAARASKFKSNQTYMSKEGPFEAPFKEVADAWEEQVSREKDRSKKNRELAKNWMDLDQDQKEEIISRVGDYFDEWERDDPSGFFASLFDFAKDSPDGRRVMEKPYRYVEEFLDYQHRYDEEALGLIFDEAKIGALEEDGFDQATGKAPSAKMSEPATDAQYSYLQSLAETKMDVDPETAKAIQEALENKNLTKAQAGGFIGKLRELGDKENVGQYGKPSQRMIDSVNRDVYMKGLSDEDRASFLDNLENLSKGDVSSIISMLKEMPDVPGGMNRYIDSLVSKGDVDALKRLRGDDRFGDYYGSLDKAISGLESGDAGFDQRAGKPSYDFQPEVDSLRDLVDRIAAEDDAEDGDLGTYNFIKQDSLEGIDNEWEAYNLLNEMERLYRDMRPKTEKGKQLEADLGKAVDDLKTSLDAKVGPIEAAKHDPEEGYENYQFDRDVRDLRDDFFDYYYPTRATQDMRSGDGGMVGDNRGGGWEAAILFNEETGKWDAQMTSPGNWDESYAEEFENQDEAADWIDDQLATQNRRAEDYDTKILAEDGLEGLIKEYGDDPEKLADIMDGISSWLRGTNRGIAEDPARRFGEYADRLREILAKNPKA